MSLDKIDAFVTKYMKILGSNTPRPKIVVRNSIVRWLGRNYFTTAHPETSLIEIQRSILGDDKTLERVVAHEVVHHHNVMSMSPADFAMLKLGMKPSGHGRDFLEGAKKINEVMGENFVTRESDQSYVVAATKPYTILIEPALKTKLGWSWAVKLSDEAKQIIEKKKKESQAKVIVTTDPRWTSGARIKRFAGVAIPHAGTQEEKLLRELYEAA